MIIDGRALASEVVAGLRSGGRLRGTTVAVVVGVDDPVTQSYVRIKERVAKELDISLVRTLRIEDALYADAVILQLPFSSGASIDTMRNMIPMHKDVDMLSDAAYANFRAGAYPPPPVARAMQHILTRYVGDIRDMQVVVVGQGRLVGRPAADMLRMAGADVSILELGGDHSVLASADIIALGAGDPHFLKPHMIKQGAVILDAGTSELGGKVVGDADPACISVASLMTPVPGGIGPLAVAHIFSNMSDLLASH